MVKLSAKVSFDIKLERKFQSDKVTTGDPFVFPVSHKRKKKLTDAKSPK